MYIRIYTLRGPLTSASFLIFAQYPKTLPRSYGFPQHRFQITKFSLKLFYPSVRPLERNYFRSKTYKRSRRHPSNRTQTLFIFTAIEGSPRFFLHSPLLFVLERHSYYRPHLARTFKIKLCGRLNPDAAPRNQTPIFNGIIYITPVRHLLSAVQVAIVGVDEDH
jgi:hypothetical protein